MAFKMSQECLTVSLDITCCPGSQETLSLILMTKIRCQSLHYIVSAVSASLNNVIFEPWIFFFIKTDFPKTSKSGAGSGTHSLSRVSGTEEEYSLSEAKVKHHQARSPNGWVTAMC